MPIFQLTPDDPTFPWFGPDDPILWWSPDPRVVLYPAKLHISRRLRRKLNQNRFLFTCDTAFEAVIRECASNRPEGTWIGPEMVAAYAKLFKKGYAHSIEVWQQDQLVGGVYGIALGQAFFGESMFHRIADASKAALAELCRILLQRGVVMIDCQVESEHLLSLGAELVPRAHFLTELNAALQVPVKKGSWT